MYVYYVVFLCTTYAHNLYFNVKGKYILLQMQTFVTIDLKIMAIDLLQYLKAILGHSMSNKLKAILK